MEFSTIDLLLLLMWQGKQAGMEKSTFFMDANRPREILWCCRAVFLLCWCLRILWVVGGRWFGCSWVASLGLLHNWEKGGLFLLHEQTQYTVDTISCSQVLSWVDSRTSQVLQGERAVVTSCGVIANLITHQHQEVQPVPKSKVAWMSRPSHWWFAFQLTFRYGTE